MAVQEADYLVVGAGAMGMAFVDALIDHADVSVVMVDRRHGVGGHWLDAYPFVRLHQASALYGVASTPFGGGRIQERGPEAGLHERATAPEICAYFDRIMRDRLIASGKVTFHPNCDYVGEGRFVSRVTGREHEVRVRRSVVDARYLAPDIPSVVPPPFEVAEGAHVIPINDLVKLEDAPSQFVVVGSGKTATDACVWLIDNGLDPDAICWVRPRDPWMLNRAVIQPEPATFIGAAADTMRAASESASAEEMFLRMEEAGVVLRVDRSVTPTMARTPTLAQWELDRLRTIDNVLRLGHVRCAAPGRLSLEDGEVAIAPDAVVVHCAARGLRTQPQVPIWGSGTITLQPVRAGFPVFGAAVSGFVEATVAVGLDPDQAIVAKNAVCPSSTYPNGLPEWSRMQVTGGRAAAAFGANPEIKAWADQVALNPARTSPELMRSDGVAASVERLKAYAGPGMGRLAEFAGMSA
ncbi:pyridine nucleotide-disulfide oxidoreductase [Nocardioides sp. JQ2195]|uniref:NAD(P)-binding protein n=1 Tax=Nocardioides sp. JQ2195 TaxID=2592334 RepID=UPI00143E4F3C|nr:pyridine nucleotide-disulfide oxidoreductase [Nocardioides sp. JQ2195]QIX27225.1 pyridine nucleotide-disulfide oxidoreductase [Nocardioides sp. JQ2195]